MKPNPALYDALLQAFDPALHSNVEIATKKSSQFTLPQFSEAAVAHICRDAVTVFASQPTLLELSSPITVVGDIHGHILDLIRIFQTCGYPPKTRYLFLGDLIDRGEFSVETILLLFILKVRYPDSVFILRGNHEFQNSAEQFGFLHEVTTCYGRPMFDTFMQAFSWLPLAAILDKRSLCIHGGVGATLSTAGQIRLMSRPILTLESEVLSGMLWSDPTDETDGFLASGRGAGSKFGRSALFEVLVASRLMRLIRGHEFKQEGFEKMFDGHCVTVFSASNYCGMRRNRAAVLVVYGPDKEEVQFFPPLEFLKRGCVKFVPVPDPPGVKRWTGFAKKATESPTARKPVRSYQGRSQKGKTMSSCCFAMRPIAIEKLTKK